MKLQRVFPLVVAMLVIASFVGCETEREPEVVETTTVEVVTAPPPAPSPAPTGTSGTMADTENMTFVELVDYEIVMPNELPAGNRRFPAVNKGSVAHAFEIEGQGIEQETEQLQPGATGILEVNLEPGSYRVYCPVGDHASARGMETQLTVTEEGTATRL